MSDTTDWDAVLGSVRVVPVAVVDESDCAVPLACALMEGGLPCVEVTFRTDAAADVVRLMSQISGFVVGAGSIRTAAQVDIAAAAGASYIVSPGFSADVVRRARELGIPVLPGVATATEIMMCLDAGIHTVKLFPAEALGGVGMLSALSAPFRDVSFVPTGGISESNAPSYLQHPAVVAVGGSWMVPKALLSAGDFSAVTQLTSRAVALYSARPS